PAAEHHRGTARLPGVGAADVAGSLAFAGDPRRRATPSRHPQERLSEPATTPARGMFGRRRRPPAAPDHPSEFRQVCLAVPAGTRLSVSTRVDGPRDV